MPKDNKSDKAPSGIKNPIKLELMADYWKSLGLDMSSRRYRQIAKEGRVDEPRQGWVDGYKAPIQVAIYYQGMAEGKGDSTHEEIKKQRDLEKLEMEKMERKKMEGSLIDRDTVSEELVKRIHVMKSDLLALEKRLARWPEAKEVAAKFVRHLMTTYSRKTGVFGE
jgi:hypothetical protein